MKYQVILFDADGMTIQSPRFSDRLEKEHGITWEKMKPFFQGPFNDCKLGKSDLKQELAKVVKEWGWHGTVDELMAFWFKDDVIGEDIIDLVKNLRSQGVRCYLATNQEAYRAQYLRNDLGLSKIFDGLFVSTDIGYLKKDPKFFEEIVADLNEASRGMSATLDREQILFVDHEAENIAAAKQASLSTYTFHDMDAFKEFLKQAH